jgi:hypothetical protein
MKQAIIHLRPATHLRAKYFAKQGRNLKGEQNPLSLEQRKALASLNRLSRPEIERLIAEA